MLIKRSLAFTLIEIMLVLSIITALVVAVFVIYPRIESSRITNAEMQTLSTAQAVVQSMYPNGNYFGLNVTMANQSDVFPSDMELNFNAIRNRWGGAVTISPANPNGIGTLANPASYFRIVYNNVPHDLCIKLASQASYSFSGVFIGPPGSFVAAKIPDADPNLEVIPDACRDGANDMQSIIFLFSAPRL